MDEISENKKLDGPQPWHQPVVTQGFSPMGSAWKSINLGTCGAPGWDQKVWSLEDLEGQ